MWIAAKIKSDISTKSITTSAAFQMPLAVMLLYFRRIAVNYYFILPLSTDLCETLKTAWLQVKEGLLEGKLLAYAGMEAGGKGTDVGYVLSLCRWLGSRQAGNRNWRCC